MKRYNKNLFCKKRIIDRDKMNFSDKLLFYNNSKMAYLSLSSQFLDCCLQIGLSQRYDQTSFLFSIYFPILSPILIVVDSIVDCQNDAKNRLTFHLAVR